MKLRGSSSNGGQNRKDKSIDGENDVNVEVTVQKRISDVYAGNGNENATSSSTTVRRESVKLGQREGRKNKKRNGNKKRKGGLRTKYCMDEEVKTQCSNIRKKSAISNSTKTYYLHFQKWQKNQFLHQKKVRKLHFW